MFIQNKYTKAYFNIIERFKIANLVGDFESHHIIPKSFGGTDDPENLVQLPLKAHYICHLLLTKMPNNEIHRRKMIYALWQMSTRMTINARQYESAKSNFQNLMKTHNPMFQAETVQKVIESKTKSGWIGNKQKQRKNKDYSQSETAKRRNLAYWNEETKLKLSNQHQSRFEQKNLTYECVSNSITFHSQRKAEVLSMTGISRSALYQLITNKRASVKGWSIKLVPVDSVSKSNRQNSA